MNELCWFFIVCLSATAWSILDFLYCLNMKSFQPQLWYDQPKLSFLAQVSTALFHFLELYFYWSSSSAQFKISKSLINLLKGLWRSKSSRISELEEFEERGFAMKHIYVSCSSEKNMLVGLSIIWSLVFCNKAF